MNQGHADRIRTCGVLNIISLFPWVVLETLGHLCVLHGMKKLVNP